MVRTLGLKFVQLLKLEAEEKTGEIIDVPDGEDSASLMIVGAIECSIMDDSAKVQAALDAAADTARTPYEAGWSPDGAPEEPLMGYRMA